MQCCCFPTMGVISPGSSSSSSVATDSQMHLFNEFVKARSSDADTAIFNGWVDAFDEICVDFSILNMRVPVLLGTVGLG